MSDTLLKPERKVKDYYKLQFYEESKKSFLEQATKKCEGKEDTTVCLEKFSKCFDSVFGYLKEQLELEDKIVFKWDKRNYYQEGPIKYAFIPYKI
jgi:hypothetical protein